MLDRYWVFPRKNGVFYFQDKITGKQQSTRTKDKVVAERLLAAKNQSVEQPMLNRSMAKTYLAAKSPELMERTWADVVARYAQGGSQESMDRTAGGILLSENSTRASKAPFSRVSAPLPHA